MSLQNHANVLTDIKRDVIQLIEAARPEVEVDLGSGSGVCVRCMMIEALLFVD